MFSITALNYLRSNIPAEMTEEYLLNCTYNNITDPLCPAFSINQILEEIESNITQRQNILEKVIFL